MGLTVPSTDRLTPPAYRVKGSERARPRTPFRSPLGSSCHPLATPLATSAGHGGAAVCAVPPSGVALQVQARLFPKFPRAGPGVHPSKPAPFSLLQASRAGPKPALPSCSLHRVEAAPDHSRGGSSPYRATGGRVTSLTPGCLLV